MEKSMLGQAIYETKSEKSNVENKNSNSTNTKSKCLIITWVHMKY